MGHQGARDQNADQFDSVATKGFVLQRFGCTGLQGQSIWPSLVISLLLTAFYVALTQDFGCRFSPWKKGPSSYLSKYRIRGVEGAMAQCSDRCNETDLPKVHEEHTACVLLALLYMCPQAYICVQFKDEISQDVPLRLMACTARIHHTTQHLILHLLSPLDIELKKENKNKTKQKATTTQRQIIRKCMGKKKKRWLCHSHPEYVFIA